MNSSPAESLPADLLSELERKFFWWESISGPRSHQRILAEAIDLASFSDVRRMEEVLGPCRLAEVMLNAAPGWISDRSWEFWRGRLSRAIGARIPDIPPRRSFDVGPS